MPKRTYALEPNGEKSLEISWGLFWKNIEVRLNGDLLGTIPTQQELSAGQTFPLPDGSALQVQLAHTWLSAELRVLRNGVPLPGSGSDPATRLAQSYGVIYFIGGFNILLGIIAQLFQVEPLLDLGLGVITIGIGLIYLALAFFTQRRSLVALIIAMALYGLDSLLMLFNGLSSNLVIRIFFLIWMAQGIGAIRDLKKETPPADAIEG